VRDLIAASEEQRKRAHKDHDKLSGQLAAKSTELDKITKEAADLSTILN